MAETGLTARAVARINILIDTSDNVVRFPEDRVVRRPLGADRALVFAYLEAAMFHTGKWRPRVFGVRLVWSSDRPDRAAPASRKAL